MFDDDVDGPLMGDYRFAPSAQVSTPPPPPYEVAVGQQERFSAQPKSQDIVWAVLFWIQLAGKMVKMYNFFNFLNQF